MVQTIITLRSYWGGVVKLPPNGNRTRV